MANFSRKTALGVYKDVDAREEATHCTMELREYDKLVKELKELRKYRKDAVEQIQRAVEVQNDVEDEMAEYKAYYENLLEQEKEKIIELANEEIKKAIDLNNNLKRIMVERANADRKIKPKKEHHGYRVISQQFVQFQFDGERKRRWCYRLAYETPFSAKLSFNQVKKLVRDDIDKIKAGTNIEDFFPDNSMMTVFSNFFEPNRCLDVYVMEDDYRANYRSGYYEAFFYTNYEVKFI